MEKSQLVREGVRKSAEDSTKQAEMDAVSSSGPRASEGGGESAVLAKIAAMPEPYNVMGQRLHAIITTNAPALSPKVWYGMSAYAKDGKVVCFFRGGEKFNFVCGGVPRDSWSRKPHRMHAAC